jgi:hypothetical protein
MVPGGGPVSRRVQRRFRTIELARSNGGRRREVVQVLLLALTIVSTVAGVSAALSALGLLPQRRRQEPRPVVIIVVSFEPPAGAQPDCLSKRDPKRDNGAGRRRGLRWRRRRLSGS